MPTAAERQALLFLAAVALVGGGARVVSSRRFEAAVSAGEAGRGASRDARGPERDGAGAAQDALERQIVAIDSAQAVKSARKAKARGSRVATGSRSPRARPPRGADSSPGGDRPTLSRGGRRGPPEPIDVNSASAEELEQLPRVGPALARRIVEWRDQHGPFESVESLRHVRGIGVTTAALLSPLVTFSRGSRPFRGETAPSRRDPVPPAL